MDKEKIKKFFKKNKKVILIGCGIALGVSVIIGVLSSSEGDEITKVSSTFEGFVEKAELNVATFNYNVIAKKCKDGDKKCDKKSNDISDFEHVVSCKGKVVVKYQVEDIKYKHEGGKVFITMPKPIVDTVEDVKVNSLNGGDHPASSLPKVIELCKNEIRERSSNDEQLIETSQNQATVVLKSFYEQLEKINGDSYEIIFE
ncbi:MAG: DUF4230 domain-containing protein [Bacilli bacterium]|nr:DUF4230 domain-containing protein [Bacilli bacterium]